MRSIAIRLDRVVSILEDASMIFAMALITLLICIQVILRYVFDGSLSWVEELVRYTVVWMSLIGAGLGLRTKAHITVSVLLTAVNSTVARVLLILSHVLILIFSVLLAYYGSMLALQALTFGQLSSALRIPMGIVYACLPLGGLLLAYRSMQALNLGLRNAPGTHDNNNDVTLSGGL